MGEYGEVEGQCGTCLLADGFDYGPSPSGPEDGVHCTSYGLARETGQYSIEEIGEYGFLDIFRLEALAEEDHRCSHWISKQTEVKEQMFPAPDEAPLTDCPWCGKEYDTREEQGLADYAELAPHLYRHSCSNLVRFPDKEA